MNTIDDFTLKKRKYMPTFPRAIGKPTVYIDGYPYEEDEPMPAGQHQGYQLNILLDSLTRFYEDEDYVHIGMDCFVYYRDNDEDKFVSPDIFVAFGVKKTPPRYSFYTWAEGASPTAVFEFLSESTADRDRQEKRNIYLKKMGVQEYFIHQPDPSKPAEFRGWRRTGSGRIEELPPGANGELFSEALNLLFRYEDRSDGLRLLRAYLPDGTPLTTSAEEARLRKQAEVIATENAEMAAEEAQRRRISEAMAAEAAEAAAAETQRREAAEAAAAAETQRREAAEAIAAEAAEAAAAETQRREAAEAIAAEAAEAAAAETQRRQELEAELERLRAQIEDA